MVDKHDVRRFALVLDGVVENGDDSFEFRRDGLAVPETSPSEAGAGCPLRPIRNAGSRYR